MSEHTELTPKRLDQMAERLNDARRVSALASWPLGLYRDVARQQADSAALLAEVARLRAQVADLTQQRDAARAVVAEQQEQLSAAPPRPAGPAPGEALRDAADEIVADCPDHGSDDRDTGYMACHCDAADYLRRLADDADAGPTPGEALRDSARLFLTFALELAADQMSLRPDEFDADDQADLERLMRLAGGGS
ncbi:hypothetical protein RM844_30545 [Streptomyces sp. DSM 44915]|uniref:Uncharacterized protein n=1 Tax=Streptomyces chisholmiae TaxID=3075540 RepID=A0ABU2K0U2_9ACTN|nr:hypothetical protein [Streptomyces sp. DSM 44915]MDT0270621.1 hypothetical protein [Streptomyces sp. DSM 44915]